MADAQVSGRLPPRDPSWSDTLHYRAEPLLKFRPFPDPGSADALALLLGLLHPSQHQVPMNLLPGGILIPDPLPSQGSWDYRGSASLRWPPVCRVWVGPCHHYRTRCHLSPQLGS